MSWRQWCQDYLAKRHKISVCDEEADMVLFEHTGFPSFFEGDAKTWFGRQIDNFVERLWAGESPNEQAEANLAPACSDWSPA